MSKNFHSLKHGRQELTLDFQKGEVTQTYLKINHPMHWQLKNTDKSFPITSTYINNLRDIQRGIKK